MQLTALLASAALVVSACGGTPGQAGDTTAAPAGTTSAAASESGSASASASGGATSSATGSAGAGAGGNVGEVGGSGCGTPSGEFPEPPNPGGEVRVAWNDPLLSFNNNTTTNNAAANQNINYLTQSGFRYYDEELNLINNDQFGTCVVESLDPLSVTYTINEGVTWSDGTQIGAADLLLYWAAQSGAVNTEEVQTDEEGAVIPGAGVAFNAADPSMELITETPVIGEDGRSVTATWSEFYVDYQTAGVATEIGNLVPAHIVAKNALSTQDAAAGQQAVIDAITNKDNAALKPIADFYNTGFDTDALPTNPDLYLSSGPFKVTAYEQRAAITLERNETYNWGPKPSVDRIQYQIIGDPTAAVQALTNEEIDVIAPQATADIYAAVSALADRGIQTYTGVDGTYEHIDLVFANGGPFDPATYGGDEAKALAVRQAFLKTIPRQDIVDRLIKPINPDAVLRNSFTQVPGSPNYDAIAEANGSAEYATVDIPGAQALLAQAGVTTPIDVRLKFAENNPRRANEYDLIKASAAQAGFNLVDGRSASWGQELPNISLYDASMFGWQSEVVGIADTNANFVTDGQNNYGKFSNDAVDTAYSTLQGSQLENDAVLEQLIEVESNLVANAFGTTIFQFPAVVAWNENRILNVKHIPLSPTVFWNFWEWEAVQ